MATCPSPELLADYALGRCSVEDLELVAAHVAQCDACQARFDGLDGLNDSFVCKLRQPPEPDMPSHDAELEALVAQAEAIPLDAGDAENTQAPPPRAAEPSGPSGGPPATLGQYQFLARLGRGGMGTVYKARHLRLKRLVAVKVISQRRLPDSQAVARFHREMEAVGRLGHPNIVQATDAGEAGGQHFLAMEFVEGSNLAQLVRAGGSLPVADACEIARQAAVGLEHAHGHGLVHRDVKPSNLMLASDGTVKVLDLGLARLLDGPGDEVEATGSEQILGSPDFMAPEQVQDSRQVDARTDLYSLGCTLYFLLTGRPPFAEPQHDTRLKKIMAHVREQPTPIQVLRSDLPAPLTELLGRLLAKNANDRPRLAAEVSEALVLLSVGNDLVGLLRDRPVPETDQESSVEAGLFDEALGAPPAQPSAPAKSLLRRVWPVVAVAAIVAGGFAWAYWPHHSGNDTAPPTAIHEQQASPIPSADAATGTIAPTPTHKPAPPPVPSAEVNRMTQSWKDTHDDFKKLMEQVEAGNRQLEKENERRDAEAEKSKAKARNAIE
jgi:serine/threonine protein kinase